MHSFHEILIKKKEKPATTGIKAFITKQDCKHPFWGFYPHLIVLEVVVVRVGASDLHVELTKPPEAVTNVPSALCWRRLRRLERRLGVLRSI